MATSERVQPLTGELATLLGERRDGPRPKASNSKRDIPAFANMATTLTTPSTDRGIRALRTASVCGERGLGFGRTSPACRTDVQAQMKVREPEQHDKGRPEDHGQADERMQDVDSEVLAPEPARRQDQQDASDVHDEQEGRS